MLPTVWTSNCWYLCLFSPSVSQTAAGLSLRTQLVHAQTSIDLSQEFLITTGSEGVISAAESTADSQHFTPVSGTSSVQFTRGNMHLLRFTFYSPFPSALVLWFTVTMVTLMSMAAASTSFFLTRLVCRLHQKNLKLLVGVWYRRRLMLDYSLGLARFQFQLKNMNLL